MIKRLRVDKAQPFLIYLIQNNTEVILYEIQS